MGSTDRGFAAETVYGCLRRKRELEALYAPVRQPDSDDEHARWLVATWLLKYGGWSARALADTGFNDGAVALVERIRALDLFEFPLEVRANLPDWMAHMLVAQFGPEQTLQLAEALNQPAPVDLRVNLLKITREALQAQLRNEGFELAPTPYSPLGLRREQRAALFNTRAFGLGLYEVQDEGSQLVSLLMEASPGEKLVDFCAGAGGKTLQLATQMRNTGVVQAFDVSRKRLDRFRPRLNRAGVDNVQRHVLRDEHDPVLKPLAGKADAVLVDAPCSGVGTLRRNPDVKWKNIDVAGLQRTQRSILAAASRLVKPGGRLVYATCSLLAEENAAVTASFLAEHPDFTPVDAREILVRQGVMIPDAVTPEGALQLLPHRHGTDGFYALVMRRSTDR
ncbi:MAG: RsmB/NOP family class I SAM-dependent RNA methyltransferase [Gammaproteobacteria bacterium]|nr:RsmB/NOP family class I SAM-dependent RNA methyltransferase [Gammaproteobacteria bacterium]MDE1887191.1 RsmB/NOP family class I SAM-dependent RNA methyltransferase [Gammaproteobacteria bacterium]MDE2023246.1 RsmB/NOP family class I SAM-dependent RNA methyltransferase [Gammaproteobacteria bacterium]MDE2140184.1 RsmB/NOP family class I SAM-dependent RNA methyltransferase [Gammaproteobacteria bacterium]MDE2272656.1 RsmB/NOP family class I SAM-dependent RNA methyltransferase [Gammaproteobacteria